MVSLRDFARKLSESHGEIQNDINNNPTLQNNKMHTSGGTQQWLKIIFCVYEISDCKIHHI